MLTCFLQAESELARESAVEQVSYCFGDISLRDSSRQNAVPFTNFGSTCRLHYFSAIHKVRAHTHTWTLNPIAVPTIHRPSRFYLQDKK